MSEMEQALLLQGLSKLLLLKAAKDGSITVGPADKQFVTTIDTVTATLNALASVEPGTLEPFPSDIKRRALRCCTGYLKTLIYSLTTATLPAYDKKVAKAGADNILKNKYKVYITVANDKLTIATKLLNKMEREL